MNRFHREMIRLCDDVIALESGEVPLLAAMAVRAVAVKRRLEGRSRAVAPPSAEFKGATRADAKATKKAQQRKEMAILRIRVMARASGSCELCGRTTFAPLELVHLNGGSGRRREQQSIENCLAGHSNCHRGLDGIDVKPAMWTSRVTAWCDQHGYPLPERWRILAMKEGMIR